MRNMVMYLTLSLSFMPKYGLLFGLIMLFTLVLKIVLDLASFISLSSLFQSLVVEGKNESLCLLVLQGLVLNSNLP